MSDPETDHDVDRMTDLEALMWQLEKNPLLSNVVANVTVLDRPPDADRLLSRMAVAVQRVPRLHQRPVAPAGRLANPEWRDDPDFDLEHHVRWADLGGGATDADLEAFVALVSGQPFDRERPLWDFTVIEGLEGGRAAMLQRMHHTITDGEGGIRLSVAFLDLERSPEPADDASGDVREHHERDSGGAGKSDHHDSAETDGLTGAAAAVGDSLRRRSGQIVGAVGAAGSMAMHPGDAAEMVRSVARQVRIPSRCSPLWTERTLQRWFGTTVLDLAEVKEAAHRLGGTVNDLFVTGAAAGAGAYHRHHGAAVDQLRLSMPVSVRHDIPKGERGDPMSGGNAFSPTQTLVPTGDSSPADRFAEIHEVLAATRAERALSVIDGAAAVFNLLPTAALLATGERATAGIDFVCSNVRAAPFDLYIGGALMESNYPIGPLAGTAFNLTTMSYRGKLFLGLNVDAGAVEHPGELLGCIENGHAELLSSAH